MFYHSLAKGVVGHRGKIVKSALLVNLKRKMKWFKFYGQDYLSDPKMLSLNAGDRSCWITILAYSSINDNGMITHLDEYQLMIQAGLDPMSDSWGYTEGILNKLVKLGMITNDNGMITVVNWQKRQETNLTSYERVKRYREKKRDDNAVITLEENRREENKEDKKKELKKDSSISYLREIPTYDLEEFYTRFDCSRTAIKDKAESLALYCEAKGKKYSNYRSMLLNALKKDFPERRVIPQKPQEKEVVGTAKLSDYKPEFLKRK